MVKKVITFLLILLIIASSAACSKKSTEEEVRSPSREVTDKEQVEEAKKTESEPPEKNEETIAEEVEPQNPGKSPIISREEEQKEAEKSQTEEKDVNETDDGLPSPDDASGKTEDSSEAFVLGNIVFAVPNGFDYIALDENKFAMISEDKICQIVFACFDISVLDEEKTKLYLPMQHDTFLDEEIVRVSEGDLESEIAGFPLIIDCYGDASASPWTLNMDTTFTDSWYSYTILYRCDGDSELLEDYNMLFIEMTFNATYTGPEPRFDYVQ